LRGEGGSVGKDSTLNVHGLACILVRAGEGEADWVVDEGGECGLVSWSGGNPSGWIVVLRGIDQVHQEVDHHKALAIGDDNGSVVETNCKSNVVP
jgi:hypothetical protein